MDKILTRCNILLYLAYLAELSQDLPIFHHPFSRIVPHFAYLSTSSYFIQCYDELWHVMPFSVLYFLSQCPVSQLAQCPVGGSPQWLSWARLLEPLCPVSKDGWNSKGGRCRRKYFPYYYSLEPKFGLSKHLVCHPIFHTLFDYDHNNFFPSCFCCFSHFIPFHL